MFPRPYFEPVNFMKIKIVLFGLLAAGLLALPAQSFAQDAASGSSATPAPAKAKHGAPFHGTVDGLDTNAMTLTVGSRTFQITSETHIMKDDKPAILADGVAGQPVTGYYKPEENGTTLDAVTVYFGTHAKAKAAHKKKKAPASEAGDTNAPPAAPMTSPVPPPPPVMTPPPSATPPPPPAPSMTGTNSSAS
jgi:hypothetical protein